MPEVFNTSNAKIVATQFMKKFMMSVTLSASARAVTNTETDEVLMAGRFMMSMDIELPTTPTKVITGLITTEMRLPY